MVAIPCAGVITYPPEMLPVGGREAEVWVCVGDCGNEPPCPICWCAFDGENELEQPASQ